MPTENVCFLCPPENEQVTQAVCCRNEFQSTVTGVTPAAYTQQAPIWPMNTSKDKTKSIQLGIYG